MKTLLLNPPSFDGFDGGAGSRWQARREVYSFWYPTWLCYTGGLIRGSRVVDAPASGIGVEETVASAKDFDLVAIYTSAPGFPQDVRLAERIKAAHPSGLIGLIGPYPTVLPEETLKASPAIDFVTRGEFDYMLRDIAAGPTLPRSRASAIGRMDESSTTAVHNASRTWTIYHSSSPFISVTLTFIGTRVVTSSTPTCHSIPAAAA
jgi:hypothetical protein